MVIRKIRCLFGSFPFAVFLFFLACLITVFRWEFAGVIVFVSLISLILVCCNDIASTTLPFLLLCAFVCKCYDSFSLFFPLWRIAILPLAALIFHFVFYRRRFSIGPTFYPLCAVAFAITLGGAFGAPFSDYFSGTSLFYVGSLGIGMVVLYLLMKSAFVPEHDYDIRRRFAAVMTITGLFACFMVLHHILTVFPELQSGKPINIQWSNNISTLLMLAMPFPLYFAHKRGFWWGALSILFYACTFLTGSRGGILMGAIELLIVFTFFSIRDKKIRIFSLVTLFVVGLLIILFSNQLSDFVLHYLGLNSFISKDESRVKLLQAAWEDFRSSPIFGKGIGYTGNADIYSPKKGGANWYHIYIAQVIGSFGLVGVAAFGWQLFVRFRLIIKKHSSLNWALGLSYVGLFLMSQVNPGEFCPLPYELLAVLLFVLLELPAKRHSRYAFLPFPWLTKERVLDAVRHEEEKFDEEKYED